MSLHKPWEGEEILLELMECHSHYICLEGCFLTGSEHDFDEACPSGLLIGVGDDVLQQMDNGSKIVGGIWRLSDTRSYLSEKAFLFLGPDLLGIRCCPLSSTLH